MARAADKRRQLLRVATIFFALGGHATAGERDQRAVRTAPTPQTINQIVKSPATAGGKREAKPGHHRPAERRKKARKLRDAPHTERAAVGTAKPDGVDTESIFGFTEGSDAGAKGGWTIFHDSIVRAGRNAAGFAAWDAGTGVSYSLTDRAAISLAAMTSFERNGAGFAPAGMTDSRGTGILPSFKYQFLRRNEAPAGFAIQVSPYWQRTDSSPIGHEMLGSEFRLILDRALVPERWFAALNLVYLPQHHTYGDGSVEREATTEVSGAVSHRLWRDVFVGGEIRYLNKFHSYGLDQLAGSALYLGPTLFARIGDGYFGLAWSIQAAGHSNVVPRGAFDLESFERHQLRLKGGISF